MRTISFISTPLFRQNNDGSVRTRSILFPYRLLQLAVVTVLCTGLVMGFNVARELSSRAYSSNAIGSVLTFNRTGAKIVLKGIYTDAAKSFMVARFNIPETSRTILPGNLDDYVLAMESNRYTSTVKSASVMLASLSTDGDMFIGIPDPGDGLFTVYIGETNPQKSLASFKVDTSADDINLDKNLSSQLSRLDTFNKPSNLTSSTSGSNNGGGVVDMTGVKLTLAPASDSASFAPTVLPISLVDKGSFNSRGFFNEVFKRGLVKEQKVLYQDAKVKLEGLYTRDAEFTSRLVDNPGDEVAARESKATKDAIDDLVQVQSRALEALKRFDGLDFDDSGFRGKIVDAPIVHKQ